MRRSWRISGLLFVSLVALAVVRAVLAVGNSRIALRPSNAYPAARGTAQHQARPVPWAPEPTGQDEANLRAQEAQRRWPSPLSLDSA